jgi:tyrosinase
MQTPGTHNNGYFLPFHRYFLYIWENTLREECGYNGTQPWWDWTLDEPDKNGTFELSPIFDPVLGFGGNGKLVPDLRRRGQLKASCIETGPWAKYQLHLGADTNLNDNPRCLIRDFWEVLAENSSSNKVISDLLNLPTYEKFSELDFAAGRGFEEDGGGPHTTGHIGIGGEVNF